jgi:hypothetical protein
MKGFLAISGLILLMQTGCGAPDAGLEEAPAEATDDSVVETDSGWRVLLDGTSLEGWNALGDANWEIVDGAAQADSGNGFLVSEDDFDDFELRVEFWVDEPANSGVFIRCSDRETVDADNAYEVNIFDTRPEQNYRTGGIPNVAEPLAVIDAEGQWNTFEITADGPRLRVLLNGTLMVDVEHEGHVGGPIALQYGAGIVRFRRVEIRAL